MRMRSNYVFEKARNFEHEGMENASLSSVSLKGGILIFVAMLVASLTSALLFKLDQNPILLYIVALVVTVVLQIIISVKPTSAKYLSVPYCICEGVIIGIICKLIMLAYPEGFSLVLSALLITGSIVAICVIGHASKRFVISSKGKKILFTVLGGIILASVLFSITALIVRLTTNVNLYYEYYSSPLCIVVSVVMVIIAGIYVLFNIQNVHEIVDNGIGKEYEWFLSFGLALSVIWLFLEVLNLLLSIADNKR